MIAWFENWYKSLTVKYLQYTILKTWSMISVVATTLARTHLGHINMVFKITHVVKLKYLLTWSKNLERCNKIEHLSATNPVFTCNYDSLLSWSIIRESVHHHTFVMLDHTVTYLHMRTGFLCQRPLDRRLWATASGCCRDVDRFSTSRAVFCRPLRPSCGLSRYYTSEDRRWFRSANTMEFSQSVNEDVSWLSIMKHRQISERVRNMLCSASQSLLGVCYIWLLISWITLP